MRRELKLPLFLARPETTPSSGPAWHTSLRAVLAWLDMQFQAVKYTTRSKPDQTALSSGYPEFTTRRQQAFFR